jgi:dolichol-phosphate mannosyltransferase
MISPLPTFYLIVPVFNELGNLDRLLASLRLVTESHAERYRVRFVVVDDGSSDGTPERVRDLGRDLDLDLDLLANPVNQGPGAAFARAFEHLAATLDPSDWVLTLEGDNTSCSELIGQMFRRAEESYEVILASPYMYGGGITNTSPLRVFMSHMANAFVKEMLGVHGILTMSSFFRLYRGSALLKLQAYYGPAILERRGFECMVELLLKMIYLRMTISEVPMLLDTSLRTGKSKMNVTRTISGYLALSRRTSEWHRVAQRAPLPELARSPS